MATLVPSTPICLFFNLAKLQCKQTVVTDFCIGFVNKIHITGKGMIKETWIAKIKEIKCWTEELLTFCPFSPVSTWSKKLPNFAVKHVGLSWDFGHDVPCMGRRIDVNNEGGLDTRPSSLYVTWSRGMSQMSGILILSYRLKEVTNLYVLHCFWTSQNYPYLCNQMSDWHGVWIKCSISNGQVIDNEKSKLNIAKMRLIISSWSCHILANWTLGVPRVLLE